MRQKLGGAIGHIRWKMLLHKQTQAPPPETPKPRTECSNRDAVARKWCERAISTCFEAAIA
jgi:hypothetical protein